MSSILRFALCGHSISSSRSTDTPFPANPTIDVPSLNITNPGYCLDCSIAHAQKLSRDVRTWYVEETREGTTKGKEVGIEEGMRRLGGEAMTRETQTQTQTRTQTATTQIPKAKPAAIQNAMSEEVIRIWRTVKSNWDGATRPSRNALPLSGREGEKIVLTVIVLLGVVGVAGVKLEWRDRDGRGHVVDVREIPPN